MRNVYCKVTQFKNKSEKKIDFIQTTISQSIA